MAKKMPDGVQVIIELRHRENPERKLERHYFLFPCKKGEDIAKAFEDANNFLKEFLAEGEAYIKGDYAIQYFKVTNLDDYAVVDASAMEYRHDED